MCRSVLSLRDHGASFNIRIFSTGSRNDSELALIADRLQQFVLIAIQELRNEEVVRRTLDILAERGLGYRALVSSPVGRGSLERYAYLWRAKVVQVLNAGAIFPDPNDVFAPRALLRLLLIRQFRFHNHHHALDLRQFQGRAQGGSANAR